MICPSESILWRLEVITLWFGRLLLDFGHYLLGKRIQNAQDTLACENQMTAHEQIQANNEGLGRGKEVTWK